MMKYNFKLTAGILLLAFTCLWGCAPKFITNIDGYPCPEEVNMAWSTDKSVTATWFFSRWYPKEIQSRDFSEYIEYPEHLSFDMLNVLPCDTRFVVINLRIYNPGRKKYCLVKCVSLDGKSYEEPYGEWTIRELQTLVIPGPVYPGREIGFAVKILSGEKDTLNETIISTGKLNYLIKQSDSPAAGA